MTLSNFDWTDKTSVRWFIMLPTGHEGPYDLITLKQRCESGILSTDVKIWAEGLGDAIAAGAVFELAEQEELPPIPPIPEESMDEIPPLPEETYASEVSVNPKSYARYYALGLFMLLALLTFLISQWIKGNEVFSIRRQAKMSPELHQRVENELSFKDWDQKIFFKEYVPADLSLIWLVTSSFQTCKVEANFQSVKGKLLSLNDESVTFRSTGTLSEHVVEFSSFDFISGSKVVPGMYEMDLKASQCHWEGLMAKLANIFNPAEVEYVARTKVILYPQGASEFNDVLSKLLKKKADEELKIQNQQELFWQDLQQKLQTLLALSLQIEQHFLDFLDGDPKTFSKKLRPVVDFYTMKFGHFLTNFVVANETYFKDLGELGDRSRKRNYELLIRTTAKRVGLDSMKVIEELQKMKNPSKLQLSAFTARTKKTFTELKNDLNQKIIQISDDRSL